MMPNPDPALRASEVASDLLGRESLSELGDHEEPEGGVRVLGLSSSLDQSPSRGAIQSGYLVHGKGSSMTVGGRARTKAELQWPPYL